MSFRRREASANYATTTDDSITEPSSAVVESTTLTADGTKALTPEYILNRMLSTISVTSINPELAEEKQDALAGASQQIGAGQCGTIYALKGTTMVVKLPNSAPRADELFRDLKCHYAVYDAFREAPSAFHSSIHVPAPKMWVSPESSHFWSSHAGLFPTATKVPDYGLVSERIFPLPLPVRAALVDAYAPKVIRDSKTQCLSTPENKDCLIRPYLGRRGDDAAPSSGFRLRNYPLHVNQMERLELDTGHYALVMAQALAIMHWVASIDANDIEFVFGSCPQIRGSPTKKELFSTNMDSAAQLFSSDFHHRGVSIWLLDFNLCQFFHKTPAGLKKLVEGFWFNDPYYPRPGAAHAKDKALWKVFSQCYLETSARIGEKDMSQRFIQAVEDEGKRRSNSNSLFA